MGSFLVSSIGIFKDLLESLEKVVRGAHIVASLPVEEREKYRTTLDETYRLMDTALNMIVNRLDTISQAPDGDILGLVAHLDQFAEWESMEREFRLCRSLRTVVAEADSLNSQVSGEVFLGDWDAVRMHMHQVLAAEGDLAGVICQYFQDLSNIAKALLNTAPNADDIKELRGHVGDFRKTLSEERRKLIQQEVTMFSII